MRTLSTNLLLDNIDDMFRARDLARFAIGFEPLVSRLTSHMNPGASAGYPPYNLLIEDGTYKIELAVAGFKLDELEISLANDNVLVVRGSKSDADTGNTWIHRGIAARDFEKQFNLAEHIKITDAKLEDGLLTISLYREIPETSKPQRIPIRTANVIDIQTPDV
jgi:molecular chaperone IbpA